MTPEDECLKAIVAELPDPPEGMSSEDRDKIALVALKEWVEEFAIPSKELRAERKAKRAAWKKCEPALIKSFEKAHQAYQKAIDAGEFESIRVLFNRVRGYRYVCDERLEEWRKLEFDDAHFGFLALAEAFAEYRKDKQSLEELVGPQRRKKPIEMRERRAIERLADIYDRVVGGRPGVTYKEDVGRTGPWYEFATAMTEAVWGKKCGGIIRIVTKEYQPATLSAVRA